MKKMIWTSSIGKKQVVAITGFLLLLFIITHLGGNLFIYAGPDALNAYAHALHSVGPLLLIPRIILGLIFAIHFIFITLVIHDNIRARGGMKRYAVDQAVGQRRLSEKIMAWSGLYILAFVFFHIQNFAMADQHGPNSFIYGKSYGLYGLVYNYFKNPVHGLLYIIAMIFLSLHLSHGVQSIFQTCGFRPKWESVIQKLSNIFAMLMAIGYSSIPVYVYWMSH